MMRGVPEFRRFAGYDNAAEFKRMLIDSFVEARSKGIFFDGKIPLPTTKEISESAAYTAAEFQEPAAVKIGLESFFRKTGVKCDCAVIASALCEAIQTAGSNPKNTYYVLLSWIMKYTGAKHENIFYYGAASLRELYFLYIMLLTGADVTYVSYGQDADFDRFSHKDKVKTVSGRLLTPIQIDFSHIDVGKETTLSEMRAAAEKVKGLVHRLDTSAAGIFEDVMTSHERRVIKNGGVFSKGCGIPVYCAAVIGYDDDAVYNNMLLNFKEGFAGQKKQLIFIEKPLNNPTPDEVKALGSVTRSSTSDMIDALALLIKLNGDPQRTALAQLALKETLNSLFRGNQNVVYNYGTKFITWLYRCTQGRKYAVNYEDIPLILYYGDISKSEMYFLIFMSKCGFDVVYISPDKKNLDCVKNDNPEGRMQAFALPLSKPSGKYPDKPVKVKVATVAYSAERELDTMLYGGDTGIYRNFQFPNSQTMTLKTTYDEIGILWKQESKFRTGFSTSGNLVCVPNIFAKISGVNNGDENAYWDEIRERLTPETRLIIKKPVQQENGALDLSVYRNYYRNGKIDAEKLKTSNLNRYSYLPERIQDLLMYKLQETVESGFLKLEGDDLMCGVIHYGLSLDKEFLKMLQRFDFTKQIPKIIYIDTIEDTFTVEECIRLVLCNIIGFDILIYTPTGYRNLETYVKNDAFEEHTMNQFLYNLEVPRFRIPTEEKNVGFFGRLFRKG